jgi:uracil phosphoribosyltransferase
MVINLSETHSLVSNWVSELRDINVQKDSLRFRKNLERIGAVAAYEISKRLDWEEKPVTTPLGISPCKVLKNQPVLATILRAGLALHGGLLDFFDKAENAYISAYRKHHKDGSFEISLEYLSCPKLDKKVVIVSDPMIATGASLVKAVHYLKDEGDFAALHVVCAIGCDPGIEVVQKAYPEATIWCGAIDKQLTDKGYIVPGLGDAGDLAYGAKLQN